MNESRQLLPILNALLVFEEAGSQNSFTGAGRKLGMSQPSVSRFISNLEHHLETPLFERKHNRLQLTVNGELLHQSVMNGLSEIRAACSEVKARSQTKTLTIECTHGFSYMWLMPRMQSLMTFFPGWQIQTIHTEGGSAVVSDDADLVIKIGDGNWKGQHSLLLFEEEVFPVCSPQFLQFLDLGVDEISPAHLAHLPHICEDMGDRDWMNWRDWFACHDIDYQFPDDTRPLFNYALVLQAAMNGKGFALAWEQLAEPYLENGWLIEVPGMRVKTGFGYYLCCSDSHLSFDQLLMWTESLPSILIESASS